MVRVNIIEMMVPKNTTEPMGDHNGLPPKIIGITPIEAAAEVRNMGRIRRLAECKAASRTLNPSFIRNSSA